MATQTVKTTLCLLLLAIASNRCAAQSAPLAGVQLQPPTRPSLADVQLLQPIPVLNAPEPNGISSSDLEQAGAPAVPYNFEFGSRETSDSSEWKPRRPTRESAVSRNASLSTNVTQPKVQTLQPSLASIRLNERPKQIPEQIDEIQLPRITRSDDSTTSQSLSTEQAILTAFNPLIADSGNAMRLTVDQVVLLALSNSKRIYAARVGADVERQQVIQLDAKFDWQSFAESIYTGTNQPTATELEAGASNNRLLQDDLNNEIGVSRKNRIGGDVRVAQSIRTRNTNSQFVVPNDQGFTQLVVRYNQPLLRDGGYLVNQGQVIVADHNANAAQADSINSISQFVEEAVQAYWELNRLRLRLVVQRDYVRQIEQLLVDLRKRSKIDATASLISQVESELATQLGTLAASDLQLRQAQLRLIRAIGDRQLAAYEEFITVSSPPPFVPPVDPATAMSIALQHRPEVRSAMERIRSASLQSQIAQRQLLPNLALIMETSVAGVNDNFDVARSFGDQFSKGGPTVSAGLRLDFPFGNRAAKSAKRAANLQQVREIATFEDTVDQIQLDVSDAVARLRGTASQYGIRAEAYTKSQQVIDSLLKRRKIFPDELDQMSQLYIQVVLDAYQRKAVAQTAIMDLYSEYAVATMQLRKATGMLIDQQGFAVAPHELAAVPTRTPGKGPENQEVIKPLILNN